jgi:hypothetical protein
MSRFMERTPEELAALSALRLTDSKGKWHLIGYDDTACGIWIASTGWDYQPYTEIEQRDMCTTCLRRMGLIRSKWEENREARQAPM